MVFSSLIFLFQFLPLFLLLYFLVPKKRRNLVLLVASIVFYAWGEPTYIFLLLFGLVFDYTNGRLVYKFRSRKVLSRVVLVGSITGNLLILGFFKYAGFLADNLNALFSLRLEVSDLPLPVGLSFYTFQSLSYVTDVYRGKAQPQRNILDFGTYVMMFPQLVAGPIVKYGDIARQMRRRRVTLSGFGAGAELFICGLAKKVLIANNVGPLWAEVKASSPEDLTTLSAWLGILAFALQIYFDFSGYSDMARGLARMLGFRLKINFDYPYMSRSVTEFWRRWHISLGAWFREYVYIPLGGNRRGLANQLRNLAIVWLLTGLWHGASWNFVAWGLYFGCLVTAEKLFLSKWLKRSAVAAHLYLNLILAVLLGWVWFEHPSLRASGSFMAAMFGLVSSGWADGQAFYEALTYGLLLAAAAVCATPFPRKALLRFASRRRRAASIVVPALYAILLLLCTAYLVDETYNPFLYFRF